MSKHSESEAFEKRFARERQLRFEMEIHCDTLLGFWAAEHLGKYGADAAAYVAEIIGCDIEAGDREGALQRIASDLRAVGIAEQQVREKLRECLDRSEAEMRAEKLVSQPRTKERPF